MKLLYSVALLVFIFFTNNAYAYDLPKIFPDKEISEKAPVGSSDWTSAKNFEDRMKLILAENENLMKGGFYCG